MFAQNCFHYLILKIGLKLNPVLHRRILGSRYDVQNIKTQKNVKKLIFKSLTNGMLLLKNTTKSKKNPKMLLSDHEIERYFANQLQFADFQYL